MPNLSPGLMAAEALFRQHGGLLRTAQALALGIHPRTLYQLREQGRIESLARGLFRLAGLPPLDHPDLVVLALSAPEAVVCLTSALSLYELTQEIPHQLHIALPKDVVAPRPGELALRVFHFSGSALTEGIEELVLDGVPVRVYGPEKTIVDCFRFRNKLGLDVALDALKRYLESPNRALGKLVHFARLCHMERVMQPYLDTLL